MCRYPGCSGKGSNIFSRGDGPEVRLCDTHAEAADFPRMWCDGCSVIVKVGDEWIGSSYGYQSSSVRLCSKCEVAGKCRACGVPAAVNLANQTEAMHQAIRVINGSNQTVGWRCKDCAVNRVTTKHDATPCFHAAMQWMTHWVESSNWKYPHYGQRLTWELALDEEFESDGDGRTLGLCSTTWKQKVPAFHITVLNRVPRVAFTQTMIHELTHALAHEYGFGRSRFIEGLCNYAEYRYLLHVAKNGNQADRDVANRGLKELEKDSTWKYGEHFKYVRRVADKPEAKETALQFIKRKYQELDGND